MAVTFLIIVSTTHSFANQTPSFDASNLLDQIIDGSISPNDAAIELAQGANLPIGDANNLLQTVLNAENLTQELAGDLLQGFVGETFNVGDIQNITSVVNNLSAAIEDPEALQNLLQETIAGSLPPQLAEAISLVGDPEAIENLVRETITGALPPSVVEALTTIEGIGELINAESISDVFSNPLVTEALSNLNIPGIEPEELLAQIETIAGLVSDPAAFIQENLEQVTEQILGALETAAPELFNELATAFGGEEALNAALGGALGSLTGGTGGGSGVVLGDGEPDMCTPECDSCQNCAPDIHNNHVSIRSHTSAEFAYYREWFVTTYFLENIAKALMGMTNELVTNAMQQMQIVGTFFDAKHQMETQRLQQVLTARAHKDYHPSEALCVIGTNTASLAVSKRKAALAQITIADRMMDRQLNVKSSVAQEGNSSDTRSRVDQFIEKFCNKTDGGIDASGKYGLQLLCSDSSPDADQINADVNYTTTVENKLTLDIDFANQGSDASKDEENIFALGAHLFASSTLPIMNETELQKDPDLLNIYIDLRSMAAKRSVAQHSFAAITGMRASGEGSSAPFLKALLKESGIDDDEITHLVGENPSYFAQEEIMTKALYQNPNFYANLYDKPVNVERMGTSLLAMEIIQDRNIYDSLLRSEAVLATLVETLLLKEHRRVSGDLDGLKLTGRKRGN